MDKWGYSYCYCGAEGNIGGEISTLRSRAGLSGRPAPSGAVTEENT